MGGYKAVYADAGCSGFCVLKIAPYALRRLIGTSLENTREFT